MQAAARNTRGTTLVTLILVCWICTRSPLHVTSNVQVLQFIAAGPLGESCQVHELQKHAH